MVEAEPSSSSSSDELYHASLADRPQRLVVHNGTRCTTRRHTHDSEAFCEERPD